MLSAEEVKTLALECGFELAGVTPALPLAEAGFYQRWVAGGYAGEMRYLADHRAGVRSDPRRLLPSAKSMVCVGKLYNGPEPESAEMAVISRYAWGEDYHDVLRAGLERLVERMRTAGAEPFEWKICVDTAPLLERAYARHAGLGWIGKNSCLINQGSGSWFFLGELLVSLELAGEPVVPPPDRCGTCTRCIDACPTAAIVPASRNTAGPAYTIDSRLCISYFTIELRGPIPAEARAGIGGNVFGCDICQDVCPWNRRAPVTAEPAFMVNGPMPSLERLASLSESEFRQMFRTSPVKRTKYTGFLRNVAIAMGNLKLEKFREPLEKMTRLKDPVVADSARWALERMAADETQRNTDVF
jgi:epoxyqueuosine reductase